MTTRLAPRTQLARTNLGLLALAVSTAGQAIHERAIEHDRNGRAESTPTGRLNDYLAACAVEPSPTSAAVHARTLLRHLPNRPPLPDIYSDENGAIYVEWLRGRHSMVTFLVSADGDLAFAALEGTSTTHGSTRILDRLPPAAVAILDGIYGT